MTLKLYGHLISQPTRAVAWLLTVKGVDHELVLTLPWNGDTKTPEYLKMNPNGLVPVLQDGDFTLFEGLAIMIYLAEKHKWTDVWPEDVRVRAKVNQYLHWHHTNARLGTPEVLLPYIARAQGNATPEQLKKIENRADVIGRFVGLIEKFLVQDYVAETSFPTIADYACYCELDQLEVMGVFDFTKYPKTTAWMQRMKGIPHHENIRKPLYEFLDSTNLKPVQA